MIALALIQIGLLLYAVFVLIQIREEVENMPITQQQFDTDLAALVAAITALGTDINNLITAIQAWQASHQGADLTAEDQSVINAAQALAASKGTVDQEITSLTPPPP